MSRFAILAAALFVFTSVAGTAWADGPHKQTGPVDIQAVIRGTPHTGQALRVDVTLTPRIDVSSLDVSIVGNDGVSVPPADVSRRYGALAANAGQTLTLQVTPQAPGLQLLSIVAEVGGIAEGATRRTYTVELNVDGAGAVKSLSRPAQIDATGQRIESMRAKPRG